jgi:ribosomal protein S6
VPVAPPSFTLTLQRNLGLKGILLFITGGRRARAQIAKLEGFLLENGAVHVETLNRGRQPLAYTIRGFPEVRPRVLRLQRERGNAQERR